MKLFGFNIGKTENLNLPVLSDKILRISIDDQGPTVRPELKGITIPSAKKALHMEKIKSTVLQYHSGQQRRGSFIAPEYDLAQIGRVEDTDSYVHQAFLKKIGLLFKEGYEFVGPNPKTIYYIKLRFEQISRATGMPIDELIRSIGAGLVKKSNAFLIKVRKESASGGKVRTIPGTTREIDPIAGYFIAPPETMEVDADEYGKIRQWKQQMPNGQYKFFKPEDVVHFYFNKKDGLFFGTPTLVPVIDDIRALRKIEENIEMLIYQHLFPLFHYKIGSDEMPATLNEYGEDEIEVAKREIRYMPSEGGLVTSHRHEIKLIGSENRSLRAESYLEHFKKRVFSGLGISAVDMGEGECYDEHTQTLTENGWKFHWDIDHKNEKIATYNPNKMRIEFHIPNYKYEGLYSGPMIVFKNDNVDMMVTPEHDMLIRHGNSSRWMKMKAADVAAGKAFKNFSILDGMPFSDRADSFVITENQNEVAELAGFISSCGTIKNKKIHIKFRTNKTKTKYLLDLLTKLGISWDFSNKKAKRGPGFTTISINEDTSSGFYSQFVTEDLRIAERFKLQTRRMFVSRYVKEIFSGEGVNKCSYITKDVNEKNQIHRLLLSSGYKTRLTKEVNEKDGEHYRFWTNLKFKGKSTREINIGDVSIINHTGLIYCYNVPNHLFVTRRNNKIAIQGNTANRATSDNMSRNLVDSVKDIQRTLESQFTDFVINELLLEADFGEDVLDLVNEVTLKFKEIDLDHQIKKEAHYADQFAKNVITLHEARSGAGRQPFRIPSAEEIESTENIEEQYPEWFATFWKLIEEPKALINSSDEPYTASAKAAAASRSTAITEKGRVEAGEEQQASEIALEKAKGAQKKKVSKDSFLSSKYKDLEDDTLELSRKDDFDKALVRQLAFATRDMMARDARSRCMGAFLKGYSSLNKNKLQESNAVLMSRSKINNRVDFYVGRLMNDVISALERQNIANIEKDDRIHRVKAIFDSLRYRNDFIEDVELRKMQNLGLLQAAKDLGFAQWRLIALDDSCESCKEAAKNTYSLAETLDPDEIPPFHANARARIEIIRG